MVYGLDHIGWGEGLDDEKSSLRGERQMGTELQGKACNA